MRLSNYFLPILKDDPRDAVIASHRLMVKAGLIRQTHLGIYMWLPLGLIVLDNISRIIKSEMLKAGAIQVLMPTIQSSSIWEESGRYDSYGSEMLRIIDRHQTNLLYGPTNEEQITQILRDNVQSYKQLPINLYHIQWKFRDEIRPRFGIMRCREFLMKDAYSFDLTQEAAHLSYKKMFCSYLKIFQNIGLKAIPVKADTGPIGGDLSHEFVILADTGESKVFLDQNLLQDSILPQTIDYENDVCDIYKKFTSYYALAEEKYDDTVYESLPNQRDIISKKGIEVGHVFYFADKYSVPMGAAIRDAKGNLTNLMMGSYGIGISRLVAAIIEAYHDDKGILWPDTVSPFHVIINSLSSSKAVVEQADSIYNFLCEANMKVLYNDKDDSVSNKLYAADLIGIPYQINIGNKSMQSNTVELKSRRTGKVISIAMHNFDRLLEALNKGI